MAVSLRLSNDSKRWQLQWKSSGKKTVYVAVSSLYGNKIAAERVAMRLKTRVEGASSRQNVEPFLAIRDKFVAEELASLHRQAALANSAVITDGGSTAEEQIRESPLDQASARVAVTGTMGVSCGYDERQKGWHIQWRCHGQHSIRVSNAAVAGDKAASERVAQRLQRHIEEAQDRSDKGPFRLQRDSFVEEELNGTAAADSDRTRPLDPDPQAVTFTPSLKRIRLVWSVPKNELEP